MIRLAIQKSGRLNKGSLNLLSDCGISIDKGENQLKVSARNFPIEIFFLRNSDIPQYLKDGVVDLAIVGENLLKEKEVKLKVIEKLNTVNSFLKKNKIKADLHIINGSVEIAPNIGLADAICDIVSTGSTLFKNNLKEVIKIDESQAVLVKGNNLKNEKLSYIEKLQFRVQAVLRAKKSKYILLNAPNNKIKSISSILPVLKSPTVLPLAQEGWSSLHSVINDQDFWEVIDQLKEAGAEDILVCPIEKMVL